MPPPRKRADVLLVERGLFESRARAQAAIEAGLVTANDRPVAEASDSIARRRRAAGAARASLCLARRRQAGGRAGAISDRHRGPRLSRCRRIDRRLHRGAARQRRQPGVCDRRRARAAASVAARPSQDRFHGGDRYPQLRRQAAADAAGHRRHRRQLHLAESRAAGGAVAGGGADASAGADQAAIRGGAKAFQARHHPQCHGAPGKSATTSRRLPPRSAAPISRCFRPRSRAATATSNSSSARAVVERLVIDHVGHRGDGVAFAGRRERVRAVHAWRRDRRGRTASPAIPTAGACSRSSAPAPNASRRSARISAPAAAARSSTGRPDATAPGNAQIVVDDAGAGRHRLRGRPADRRPWRRPAAHHRSMPAAATTACCKVGFAAADSHAIVADRSLARSSIPACTARLMQRGRSPSR